MSDESNVHRAMAREELITYMAHMTGRRRKEVYYIAKRHYTNGFEPEAMPIPELRPSFSLWKWQYHEFLDIFDVSRELRRRQVRRVSHKRATTGDAKFLQERERRERRKAYMRDYMKRRRRQSKLVD